MEIPYIRIKLLTIANAKVLSPNLNKTIIRFKHNNYSLRKSEYWTIIVDKVIKYSKKARYL